MADVFEGPPEFIDLEVVDETTMSTKTNEATGRTWVEEAWNNGHIDGQAQFFSPPSMREEATA